MMTPALRLIYMRRHQHAVERRQRFERLAYHESAHAVCCVYYGRQIESLQLGFDDDGAEAGDCFAEIRTLPTFSQLVVLAAGAAAERIVTGNEMFVGADDDRSLTIAAAAFRDISEAATELGLARREAERIVGDNWQTVTALACALIEAEGQMSGEEATRFLCDVPRAAPAASNFRSEPRPAPARPSTRPAERASDLRHRLLGSRTVESTGPGGEVYRTTY